MDRGGLVGADGPTHHGVFDIGYLRILPNVTVMAPKDEGELRDMMLTAVHHTEGPIAFRYPRGNGYGANITKKPQLLDIGRGESANATPGVKETRFSYLGSAKPFIRVLRLQRSSQKITTSKPRW